MENAKIKKHPAKNQKVEFTDKNLLREAFTHRSYVHEHPELNLKDNERLEFLGDSVLGLIVTNFLYKKFPDATEGDLSDYRSALVRTEKLSEIAERVDITKYLRLGKSEWRNAAKNSQNIAADAFEAFLGALFLDKGYPVVQEFLERFLLPEIDEIINKKLYQDAKGLFQKKVQQEYGILPSYTVVEETGKGLHKMVKVAVSIRSEVIGTGSHKSKKLAEQKAAHVALEVKNWL